MLEGNDNNQETPGAPTSSEGSARNRGGAGLVTTPPDVYKNLIDAETEEITMNFRIKGKVKMHRR